MVAIFAFVAGLYYDLPLGYFFLGFIILMMDGGVRVSAAKKNTESTGGES